MTRNALISSIDERGIQNDDEEGASDNKADQCEPSFFKLAAERAKRNVWICFSCVNGTRAT